MNKFIIISDQSIVNMNSVATIVRTKEYINFTGMADTIITTITCKNDDLARSLMLRIQAFLQDNTTIFTV